MLIQNFDIINRLYIIVFRCLNNNNFLLYFFYKFTKKHLWKVETKVNHRSIRGDWHLSCFFLTENVSDTGSNETTPSTDKDTRTVGSKNAIIVNRRPVDASKRRHPTSLENGKRDVVDRLKRNVRSRVWWETFRFRSFKIFQKRHFNYFLNYEQCKHEFKFILFYYFWFDLLSD